MVSFMDPHRSTFMPEQRQRQARHSTANLFAGCDLGKSAAKFVIGEPSPDGFRIASSRIVEHDGRPMDAFRDWYLDMNVADCLALGATGLHAEELVAPVIAGLPEDASLAASLHQSREIRGAVNLVSIGARGYSILSRSSEGRIQFVENDKCSSGTGETMVKIAGRFGLTIGQADRIAQNADTVIPITARCSVFAKSEMTHFGNQGEASDALFKGYFRSVAHYVMALLKRVQVPGPVLVIGGCSRIQSLIDSLSADLSDPVSVPNHALEFEAIGAAALAAEQHLAQPGDRLPRDPSALIEPRRSRFRKLDGAHAFKDRVTTMTAAEPPEGAEREPSILGLDIGSTGTKAALTSIDSGELVLDLYDRTRGNPVEAARRLINAMLALTTVDVKAIGLTGSGREAAAKVLRATFPEQSENIVVRNEIVAHGTAAIRCDKDSGRSLSVVEIGGQDAKFIQIQGGRIVESDMNMACSAGTGSFLEEQGVFFGIEDIEKFTDLAKQSKAPPELGQMCTVFVADAAAEASNEGFATEELFGGFQYSVIHNYINRVMGQRTFGERIFFQGKPATGESLAWTLAAVTGREVVVPPNPGAMGAWGIGLCVLDEIRASDLKTASSFDLSLVDKARIIATDGFQCLDKLCGTLCNIEKTTVEVADHQHTVYAGGACPKYEISTVAAPKLPKEAPSGFDERERLLDAYLTTDQEQRGSPVGIPMVGACVGYMPWLTTFVKELRVAFRPMLVKGQSLSDGEGLCYTYDACAPVKIAHGVLDADVDRVLYPKVLSLGDRDGCEGITCVMEQGAPEMIREALHARGREIEIIHPPLSFAEGLDSFKLLRQAYVLATQLGASRARILRAFRRAGEEQLAYDAALADIGHRTIAFGREHGIPVVVVNGSLHVIHDRIINAGIPRLLRTNGVLPLPMDCFPIPGDTHGAPRMHWSELKRELRVGIASRSMGGVYPLLLSSFGCGPNSFSEQIFAKLMEGYPYSILESDGHGGTAGYVTRVQAFLHTVRQHDGLAAPVSSKVLSYLEPTPPLPVDEKDEVRLLVGTLGDRFATFNAARMRAEGFDAVAVGPSTADGLALGQKDCSGKECLVYQNLWGAYRKGVEDDPTNKKILFTSAGIGEGMCRLCLFSIKDKITVDNRGLGDRVAVQGLRRVRSGEKPKGLLAAMRSFGENFAGTLTWDLINQLVGYHRPLEGTKGECDELYDSYCDEAEGIIEHPPRRSDGELEGALLKERLKALVQRASKRFAHMAAAADDDPKRRTVLLAGDFYTSLDRLLNHDIVRQLNERGLHVIIESMNAMQEYLATERSNDLFGFPKAYVPNLLMRTTMKKIRHEFYGIVQQDHPWLPSGDMRPMLKVSSRRLAEFPMGPARKTLGSVGYYWEQGFCDGVAVVNPWGCDHGLLAEGFLRHLEEIPMLHIYLDGSPLDERKLNAFAFSLARREPRTAVGRTRPRLRHMDQ